ncbi:MAG: hypothetical protein AAF226_16370, partial [Verrucomicrobiota bacterium]
MPRSADQLELPPKLQDKLETFRRQLWSNKMAEAALIGIVGLALSLIALLVIDRFIDTPLWLRVLVLVSGLAIPIIVLPLRYRRWVWTKKTLEQVARVVRRRYPKFGDELLGIVDLADQTHGNHSDVLVRAAMEQVAERVKDQDFSDAIPNNRYPRWFITAALGLLLIFGTIAYLNPLSQNSVARWITPWRDIDRFTFAQIREVPEKKIVPIAERVDLKTELLPESDWRPAVASSTGMPG